MAAKKASAKRTTSTSRKTTAKRTARKRTAAAGGSGGGTRALSGKAARGVEMTLDLGPQASAAALAVAEKREPRPYTTRYPIPDDVFRSLKESASAVTLAKGVVPTLGRQGREVGGGQCGTAATG